MADPYFWWVSGAIACSRLIFHPAAYYAQGYLKKDSSRSFCRCNFQLHPLKYIIPSLDDTRWFVTRNGGIPSWLDLWVPLAKRPTTVFARR
jgi:hypothetical protein